ncbi:MAG TPA: cytochrome C oxidase subunit IV family protein [Flavobacteriales bacterium]|jgi:cytochrome c oxidase subunit IV|nr:cytochrome C oxidase subunit IV family protein [Flavobacteriales bacterium]
MERDDIIEYSLDAHHSEEAGRKIRRKIWMVTLFLAVVTAVEVALGAYWKEWMPDSWNMVKWTFVVLTLVKATYIVMTFMHLGDERRNIRAIILLPYALFILYLVFIAIFESNLVHQAWLRYL